MHTQAINAAPADVAISIEPRYCDRWHGSAAQLIEAGLIPADIDWPHRTVVVFFEHSGVECELQRCRPRGAHSRDPWAESDNWQLIRYAPRRSGRTSPSVYAAAVALHHAMFEESAQGRRRRERYQQAQQDTAFQAFKDRALALVV